MEHLTNPNKLQGEELKEQRFDASLYDHRLLHSIYPERGVIDWVCSLLFYNFMRKVEAAIPQSERGPLHYSQNEKKLISILNQLAN